ncbi:DUF397 domain-containing protein [Actinomadura sp. BRA 177]|uniref:DUF397 domain-containing protein n=1 Tax=Actinomadura sp. BRA 177 TaxID=2745202 RepID=UPI00159573D6|nr:DUF397 domain-containing protein [Actinomadura sp. BRA 177]NVI87833.1 DUF397 domain-containing protein [Actinomadura sp. BRA 177]
MVPQWRKSSYSGGSGGECVEVAAMPDHLLIRDSKDPDGPHLGVTIAAARDLISRVRGQ